MAAPTVTLSPKAATAPSLVSARGTKTSPRASDGSTPRLAPLAGTKTPGDHVSLDIHADGVAGADHHGGPASREAQRTNAAVVQAGSGRTAMVASAPGRRTLCDPTLDMAAAIVDDLERLRTANRNRLRIMTATTPDEDGVMRGWGLDETHPDVARLAAMTDVIAKLEHEAVLNLQRAMRKHPLNEWRKRNKGVGEKQLARLLHAIGDPYWNTAEDRPRTVSALWRYCGYDPVPILPAGDHTTGGSRGVAVASGAQDASDPGQTRSDTRPIAAGVARQRRKGQRCNWSTRAKTRAYLIAESCMKQKQDPGPLRLVYEKRRAHTAVTHPEWTAAHSHNDALRITAKEILKQLWREAKAIHEAAER